ncbi:hypothetical protein [Streptomyces sp. SID3343]|uniref:hypothetical protein n=1 Tax=Streptomyces sp. SID3343 TaxID=2690260 RepID=UPI00136F2B39|nr:hypothetical protein [Streptomyces sp. SID3343]MYW02116.1 hypothetical protein [Streptomyces sp. SID3343]
MSRTKITASAALASAALVIGGIALAGPASAAQTMTYTCSGGYGPATGSATKTAGTLTMTTNGITLPVDVAADTITTTVKTNAGNFSGTRNPEMYQDDTTIILGPLAGPSAATTLTGSGGTPSATNWDLQINIAGTNVYCVGNSATRIGTM